MVTSNREIFPSGRSPNKVNFICGVYEIVHWNTMRRYVGSSSEIEKRLYYHVTMLRVGRHHCKYLQNVWDKYGESGFEFFLLEECQPDELNDREQFHMDSPSLHELMNCDPTARTVRGFKLSESTKRKMSVTAKSIGSNPEERKRRSEQARDQHASGKFGDHWTQRPEHQQRLEEKRKEAAAKRRPRTGWKHTEEAKIRMAEIANRNSEHTSEVQKAIGADPEERRRRSERSKRLWEDPEFRRKMIEKMKSSWDAPGRRENQSKQTKKLHAEGRIKGGRKKSKRA
jgi:group I intron endonuclease